MELDELIDDKYPNACFHDSSIMKIEINYSARVVTFKMSLIVDDQYENRNQRAIGVLMFTGLYHCIVEPPDKSIALEEIHDLWVSDHGALNKDQRKNLKYLLDEIPSESACIYFFIQNWYSNIYVLAKNVNFKWE